MNRIFSFFRKKRDKHKFVILQWGQKRSLIKSIEDNEVYVLDNLYLMKLDEMGLIK